MRIQVRPFLAVAFGLVLALTGHSMAVARGASAATGQMILCIGTQSITVYVDAEGQPTAAPHICPDCVVGAVADITTSFVQSQAPAVFLRYVRVFAVDPKRVDTRYSKYASRAPPDLVIQT